MTQEKETDLYDELKKTLETVDEPEETVEEPKEELKELPDEPKVEPKEEPAAPAVETPEAPKELAKGFKNVKEFLAAVQDEPSRNLLDQFYGLMKAETSEVLAPLEQKNNEAKFESEFSKFEKIEGLGDYKNDLRKTFLRNPGQSVKALIGEVVTDLQLSKLKPIEKTPSSPIRTKVDTEKLSKDELYEMLDTLRE